MRFLTLSYLIALYVSVLGCSSGRDSPSPDTIRIHLSAEPVTLDPALAEDGASMKILGNTMDGLVGYDGEGRLENRLAQSIEVSSDRKTYRFTLKSDAKWSDGKNVEAQDFVDGFRRTLSPDVPSKMVSLLFPIKGARDYHAGKGSSDSLGVRIKAGQLVVELEKPVSYFLQVLSLSVGLPTRIDFLKNHQNKWTELAPSTGPYFIESHQPDREYHLKPNPFYFKKTSKLKDVRLVLVQDESTAVSLFEKNKIDVLTKVPSMDIERLKKKEQIHVDPFLATFYISFNTLKPPFDQKKWRLAVAGAIQKNEIVQALGSGETVAESWVPRGLEGYYEKVDAQQSFAAQVKWANQQKLKPAGVLAVFDSSSRNSLIMEKIQQDLNKNIGLELVLNNMDWKSFVKKLGTDAPPIFRFGRLAPFMDPISHLQAFMSKDPNNFSHWVNLEYDRLVEDIEITPSGPSRTKKIRRAQEILVQEEAVVIPIFHYVQTHAVSKRVKGFRVNPFGVIRFSDLTFE